MKQHCPLVVISPTHTPCSKRLDYLPSLALFSPSELVKCPPGLVAPKATLTCSKTGKKESCSLTCASKAHYLAGTRPTVEIQKSKSFFNPKHSNFISVCVTFCRVWQQLLSQLWDPHLQREVPRQAQLQQQSELHRFAALQIPLIRHVCVTVQSVNDKFTDRLRFVVWCCSVLLPTVLCLSVETLAPPVKQTASFKIKNAKCHLHPKLTGRTEDRGRTLGPGES